MNTPTIDQVKTYAAQVARGATLASIDGKALHIYRSIDGTPLYWRVRLKCHSTGEKFIRPFIWNGTAFEQKEPPAPDAGKPLYGLERLATNPKAVVIICEGENCADALNKMFAPDEALSFIALTSGGAQSVATANWQPLAGRNVLVWADNDKAGFDYAQHAAEKLKALGCVVTFVDVSTLNLLPKGDAVDWLKMFYEQHEHKATAADILALPVIDPAPQKVEQSGSVLSSSITSGGALPLYQAFEPLPVVSITCAADIKPEAIRWLWDGWLARGKFHIFAGQAGTGKTTIAIALAATISKGGCFPDGTRAPVGNVLIWSGEDSAQDTLVPRLLAAGADVSKVHFIGDVKHGDEVRGFDPATDIKAMMDAAIRIGDVALLLVDPVVNAVAGDSHKNGEVRRALQPLVEFGEKMNCAVLGISHFSKGTGGKDPMERVTGSLAFAALARIVLATAKTTDDESTRRIFCRAKSNIGQDSGGYAYDLKQVELTDCKGLFSSYAVWGEAVEGTAKELLTVEHDESDGGDSLSDAKEFLATLLTHAPLSTKAIRADCEGAGYSWATIRRAQKSLGVEAKKEGFGKGGTWVWELPKTLRCSTNIKDAQQNSVSILGEVEHLSKNSPAIILGGTDCEVEL